MTQRTFARLALATALTVCSLQPQAAQAQALPWKDGDQSSSSAPASSSATTSSATDTTQAQHHHHHKKAQQQTAAHHQGGTRTQDDRKLDALATRFYSIHEKDKDAIAKLGKLEKEVSSFHSTLTSRDYDSSDIRKDAGKLRQRIAAQHKEWEEHAAAAQASAAAVAPAPAAAATPSTPAPVAAVPPAQATTLQTAAPSASGVRH